MVAGRRTSARLRGDAGATAATTDATVSRDAVKKRSVDMAAASLQASAASVAHARRSLQVVVIESDSNDRDGDQVEVEVEDKNKDKDNNDDEDEDEDASLPRKRRKSLRAGASSPPSAAMSRTRRNSRSASVAAVHSPPAKISANGGASNSDDDENDDDDEGDAVSLGALRRRGSRSGRSATPRARLPPASRQHRRHTLVAPDHVSTVIPLSLESARSARSNPPSPDHTPANENDNDNHNRRRSSRAAATSAVAKNAALVRDQSSDDDVVVKSKQQQQHDQNDDDDFVDEVDHGISIEISRGADNTGRVASKVTRDDHEDFTIQEDDIEGSDHDGSDSEQEEVEEEEKDDDDLVVQVKSTPRKQAKKSAKKAPKRPPIEELHPELDGIWDVLGDERLNIEPQSAPQPPEITIKMLPFQLEGLNWLQKQEEGPFSGGILADEMGMGKTIQMISLIVSRRDVGSTLIICPTVAMHQWAAEIKNRTAPDTLKVLLFHGNNRPKSTNELKSYDVVLSSYSILEQGFRRQTYGVKRKGELVRERSVLHSIKWGRVVLDEAHAIKDRSNSTARAAFALDRSKQWSITGTPLQNRVGELYSLIRFMNVRPYSLYFCRVCPCDMETWSFFDGAHCDHCGHSAGQHFCWWNSEILKPIQKYGSTGEGLVAFGRLRLLLDRIMLRRTKLERTDELGLPPRVVVVRRDVFNAAEEELVTSLYSETSLVYNTYARQGTVLNNYASLFTLLSRMRLAANHPHLVTTRLLQSKDDNNETLVCCLCHDQAEDAIMSKCKHVFCRMDAEQYIQSSAPGVSPKCPACMRDLSIDLTQPEIFPKDGDGDGAGSSGRNTPSGSGGPGGRSTGRSGSRTSIVNYIDLANWRSSTKIEALVEELTTLQRDSATSKAIVFSQFVAFLDLIQWRLARAGFQTVKLDGCMGPEQRTRTIHTFMTDPSVTVFLVSLKAGGVALNLTEASRVYIMDPWWNPAVEDQAFDRIHRLGQHRPIQITRMIIENSIESRILALQEKKKALFQSTVGRDADALSKLTEEDMQFLFVM